MRARTNSTDVTNKRMLSWDEATAYTGLGRNTCRNFADQIGATIKIGKRVLFDRYKLDSYIDGQLKAAN